MLFAEIIIPLALPKNYTWLVPENLIDLAPEDATRDELVEKVLAAGATLLGDFRKDDGSGFVALRDPEGNEFCIERGKHDTGPRTPRAIRLTM